MIRAIKASREEIEWIIRRPYINTHRKIIETHWDQYTAEKTAR